MQQKELISTDTTTQLIKDKGINTWDKLLRFVKEIPYGRNAERTKFELVVLENKGTCSSKHALLKQIADLNQIEGVKLIMGIYKMNNSNTEGIGNHLSENGLDYIPEAHCYLKINRRRIDLTNPKSDIQKLQGDIIEEREIQPAQVGSYKIEYHKDFIKNWLGKNDLNKTFEEIWSIREKCIEELTKNTNP